MTRCPDRRPDGAILSTIGRQILAVQLTADLQPMNEDEPNESAENLSTVGSGRVDELFDDIEATIEDLAAYPDELESIRRRIEANQGETSGHVRNRVTQDADQLVDEADAATEALQEALERLKRTV